MTESEVRDPMIPGCVAGGRVESARVCHPRSAEPRRRRARRYRRGRLAAGGRGGTHPALGHWGPISVVATPGRTGGCTGSTAGAPAPQLVYD
jgi:hypothetical protein